MRNPVATPASVILGTLFLGFIAVVAFSYLTTSKTMYALEQARWSYVWERAFLLFTDSFFAFQCAGALIAYSLFLSVPVFFERRSLFRYLSSVVISIVVLTVLFLVCREGFAPAFKRHMRESRAVGLFSDALYRSALEEEKAGDPVTALEYLRIALLSDGRNKDKIAEKTAIFSRLTDAQYEEYLARTTGSDPREEFDAAAALERARAAFAKKDYPRALAFAQAVLAVDRANAEALRIAGIAGEKSYGENAARQTADERYLFAQKEMGVKALTAGKAGNAEELFRAYYLFLDLHRRFPFDQNTAGYLQEASDLLPSVSFFTADAELALSFKNLADADVVFFNGERDGVRELVSIEEMVAAGDRTYFRNVEVAGFREQNGTRRVLYHYLAPFGKLIGKNINLNGIDKAEPSRRTTIRILEGVPPDGLAKGVALAVPAADLHSFSLSQTDIADRGLGELFALLPPFRPQPLFAQYARVDDLIVREIALRIALPFFLIILTLFCFCIGLTQNARYLSGAPKSVYVWVLVIPFVMIAVMEVVLFLYRMGAVFLYEALGPLVGIIVIAALHVFFLILALLRFSGKIGSSLRK
jgi:tetratricopeptide (TPR) repeat protein